MEEQNKNQPSAYLDFDISDFGEPSQETLLTFADSLESLKKLAVDSDQLTTIPLDNDPDAPHIDGILNHYFIPPINDPDYQGPYFTAHIYDGAPQVMAQIHQELRQMGAHTVYINYSNSDTSITYAQNYGEEPTLYARSKHDQVRRETTNNAEIKTQLGALSFGVQGTPEFMQAYHAALEERAEAHKNGSDKPTEGTMKQLVSAINDELARVHRIDNFHLYCQHAVLCLIFCRIVFIVFISGFFGRFCKWDYLLKTFGSHHV